MSHSFGEGAAKIYLSPALLRRPTVPIALVRTLYLSLCQSVNRQPVYSDQNIRHCQYTACLCAERGLNSHLFVLSYHTSRPRIVSPTWPLGIAANSLSVGWRAHPTLQPLPPPLPSYFFGLNCHRRSPPFLISLSLFSLIASVTSA